METGKLLSLLSSYISTLRKNNSKDELLLEEDFLVSEENTASDDNISFQNTLSEFINTSDVNSDGNIDIYEQIELLNKIESEYGISCADFEIYANDEGSLSPNVEETTNVDTLNSIEDSLASQDTTNVKPFADENTEGIAGSEAIELIKEPMPIEEFQEIQTAFNDSLTNDEAVSEIIKKAYNSVTEGLATNLESINQILADKENMTPEKEAELKQLLDQRREILNRRSELEEYLKENASLETVEALTKLQEARLEIENNYLENPENIDTLLQTLEAKGIIKSSKPLSEENMTEDSAAAAQQQAAQAPQSTGSTGSSGTGGYTGSSGTPNGGADYGGVQDTQASDTMSLEELKATRDNLRTEYGTAQGNVDTAQAEYDTALATQTEAESKLADLEAAKTDAENIIAEKNAEMLDAIENSEAVSQENKEALTKLEEDITTNQTDIDNTDTAIEDAKTGIQTKETEIQTAETNIQSKETEITSARDSISSLHGQLGEVSNGETEAEKAAAKDQRIKIKSLIQEQEGILEKLMGEKEELESNKQKLIEEKQAFETTLQEKIEARATLIETKNGLEQQKNELMGKIKEEALNDETVQEKIRAWEEAKETNKQAIEDYENAKTDSLEATSKVLEATKTIDEKRNELQSIKTKLDEAENLVSAKEIEEAKNTPVEGTMLNGIFNLNGTNYDIVMNPDDLNALISKIQNGGAGNKWNHPDMCLSFAQSYCSWILGDSSIPVGDDSNPNGYPDAGKYKEIDNSSIAGSIDNIVKYLNAGQPVIMQVNGTNHGDYYGRHYVAVIGVRSGASNPPKESDLLIIDTYDGKVEGMKGSGNGTRFMTKGRTTKSNDYGYRLYVHK